MYAIANFSCKYNLLSPDVVDATAATSICIWKRRIEIGPFTGNDLFTD